MKNLAVAIYARVSSDQQAQAQTIASQVAALRERVSADGDILLPECEFLDEGYSGATSIYLDWPRPTQYWRSLSSFATCGRADPDRTHAVGSQCRVGHPEKPRV